MKRKLLILTALTLVFCAVLGPVVCSRLTALDERKKREYIGDALGGVLPAPETLTDTDTHGGFHGDGYRYAVLSFDGGSGQRVNDLLAADTAWRPLPVGGDAGLLLYGGAKDGISYGGLAESVGMPMPATGWWLCTDRYSGQTGPMTGSGLLDRGSTNLTAAVFDTARQRLYYLEYDT